MTATQLRNRWQFAWQRCRNAVIEGDHAEADQNLKLWEGYDEQLRQSVTQSEYDAFVDRVEPKDGQWLPGEGGDFDA